MKAVCFHVCAHLCVRVSVFLYRGLISPDVTVRLHQSFVGEDFRGRLRLERETVRARKEREIEREK